MANVTLNTGDEITLGAGTHTIDGSGKVSFSSTNASAVFNSAGAVADTLSLAGASTDYNVSKDGTNLVLTHKTTGKAITIASGATGDTVTFSNGSLTLQYVAGTGVKLGTQTVATTAATITDTPTGTGSGTPTGQSFSLTTAAEAKTLTTGNDTVDGSINDSITGDTIVDTSTTDNDILNATITAGTKDANIISNVENVNITMKYGSGAVDGSKITGAKILTVASNVAGGTADVTGATSSSAAKIVAGTNVSTVNVTSSAASGTGSSGVNVDLGSATTSTLTGQAAKTDIFNVTVNGNVALTTTTIDESTDKVKLTNAGTAASTVTITTGAKTIEAAGAQNLVLKGASSVFNGNTVTNSMDSGKTVTVQVTGTTTGNDLSKIATTAAIQLDAVSTADHALKFADGAVVTMNQKDSSKQLDIVSTSDNAGTFNAVLNGAASIGDGGDDFATVSISASTAVTDLIVAMATADTDVKLTGSNAITVSANSSGKSLDASAMTAAVTVNSAGAATTFTKVLGGAGNDSIKLDGTIAASTITGGAGADTITIGAAIGTVKLVIDGETGADTLKLASTGDFSGNNAKTSVIGNIETIDLNSYAMTLTQQQLFTLGNTFALTDSAGTSGTLTVVDDTTSSKYFDLSGVSVKTGLTTTVTATAGNDTVKGTMGVDAITTNAGNDNIDGGSGADTITMSTNLTKDDTVAGGEGVDILQVQGTLLDEAFTNVTTVETLTFTAAATVTLGAEAKEAGIATVNFGADSTTLNAAAFTSALAINSGAYTGTITGGSGVDTITLDSAHTDGQTLKFASTAAANNADSIVNFSTNDTTNGDVLNFAAFGVTAGLEQGGGAFTTAITAFGTGDAGEVAISNKVVLYDAGSGSLGSVDTAAEVAALIHTSAADGAVTKPFSLGASEKAVIITGATGSATAYIWYVANDATAAVTSGEVVLVGTMTSLYNTGGTAAGSIASFEAANFAFV